MTSKRNTLTRNTVGSFFGVLLLWSSFSVRVACAQNAAFLRTITKNSKCGILGFAGNNTLVGYQNSDEGRQTALFWDITSGKLKRTLVMPSLASNDEGFLTAVSSDGRLLVRKLQSGAEIFDARTGKLVFRRTFEFLCTMARLSNDSKILIIGAGTPSKTRVEIWDVDLNKLKHSLITGNDVALSKDGQWLVTNGRDTGVGVWNVVTGKLQKRLTDIPTIVNAVSISPDNTVIALWEDAEIGGSVLGLWSSSTGKPIAKSLLHSVQDQTLEFSPDNHTLLAGGRVWNWQTQQSMQVLGNIYRASFSPDGKTVAIVTNNGISLHKIIASQKN